MSKHEYVTGGNVQSAQTVPDQSTAKLVLRIIFITGMLTIIAGTVMVAITHAPAVGIIAGMGMCIAMGSLLIRDSLR